MSCKWDWGAAITLFLVIKSHFGGTIDFQLLFLHFQIQSPHHYNCHHNNCYNHRRCRHRCHHRFRIESPVRVGALPSVHRSPSGFACSCYRPSPPFVMIMMFYRAMRMMLKIVIMLLTMMTMRTMRITGRSSLALQRPAQGFDEGQLQHSSSLMITLSMTIIL